MPLKRKWQPTPVFLPRKLHGQRSLVGYSPKSPKELDMTEQVRKPTSPMYSCKIESLVHNFVSKYASWDTCLWRKHFNPCSGLWFLLACPSCTDAFSGNAESKIHATSQYLELLPCDQCFPWLQKKSSQSFKKKVTFQIIEIFKVNTNILFPKELWILTENRNSECALLAVFVLITNGY